MKNKWNRWREVKHCETDGCTSVLSSEAELEVGWCSECMDREAKLHGSLLRALFLRQGGG